MDSFRQIDNLLKDQTFAPSRNGLATAETIARSFVAADHCIAVVSDIRNGSSRIFAGEFADIIGLKLRNEENSIWEHEILSRLPDDERNEKFMAELRFFHFLKRMPRKRRHLYHLATKLRFLRDNGDLTTVIHRMYYLYGPEGESVEYAICLYAPLTFDFPGKSIVVNSVTGLTEALTSADDPDILSRREKQVLRLVADGKTSAEIAGVLSISHHTVNRHRQKILEKLNAKNSAEALQIGRSLGLF